MNIAYHYCAIKGLPDGTTAYSDGIVQSDRPIATDDLPAVRAEIAGAKGWEDGSFNIISLTRL